jgi:RNA polymerase sigma-70 factor (ECF subfamily)
MSNDKKQTHDFSLDLLRAGDKAEFARLVEAYSGVIYRLAVKMLDNPQDAEDVLQETFIKAYKALPNFDGRSSPSTWLYRIATNEALMVLRKCKQPFISIDEPLETTVIEQEPLQITDWCCLPEDELMSTEAQSYMNEAVEELPPNLRVVFLLRDIEGLSTRETAEVLDLSETAVKTRLSRARLRLREMLTGYHGERVAERRMVAGGEA